MTKVQRLIREIRQLEVSELELILEEIISRIDRRKRIEAALGQFIGSGKGVWNMDAQRYVDDLRADDRL